MLNNMVVIKINKFHYFGMKIIMIFANQSYEILYKF